MAFIGKQTEKIPAGKDHPDSRRFSKRRKIRETCSAIQLPRVAKHCGADGRRLCEICGSKRVPQFKEKVDPGHGHIIGKHTWEHRRRVFLIQQILDSCPHLKTFQLVEEVPGNQRGVYKRIVRWSIPRVTLKPFPTAPVE